MLFFLHILPFLPEFPPPPWLTMFYLEILAPINLLLRKHELKQEHLFIDETHNFMTNNENINNNNNNNVSVTYVLGSPTSTGEGNFEFSTQSSTQSNLSYNDARQFSICNPWVNSSNNEDSLKVHHNLSGELLPLCVLDMTSLFELSFLKF